MKLADLVKLCSFNCRVVVVSSYSGKILCTQQNNGKKRMDKWLDHNVVSVSTFIKSKDDIAISYLKIWIYEFAV